MRVGGHRLLFAQRGPERRRRQSQPDGAILAMEPLGTRSNGRFREAVLFCGVPESFEALGLAKAIAAENVCASSHVEPAVYLPKSKG